MSAAPLAESPIPLDKREFERALGELQGSLSKENPGSYESTQCVRCTGCMFTTRSEDCFSCTYCDQCVACSNCTHCVQCTSCHGSSYCNQSSHCHHSSYVLLSQNCHECVFCFGCVGLHKKEFHILNQPFSRTQYFKLVKELKAAFGLD